MPHEPTPAPSGSQRAVPAPMRVAASRIGCDPAQYAANIAAGLKWCAACKGWHPRDRFNRDARRGDGLRSYCRDSSRRAIRPNFTPIPAEQWRAVADYEGIYEVSDRQRVRKILDEPGGRKAPYLLRQTNTRGYRWVALYRGHVERKFGVHMLVCRAFHGPAPADGMEPNHKDGNPSNNAPDNLEWVTRSENCLHAYAMGLQVPRRGELCGRSKLTEAEVLEIRSLQGKVGQRRLARRFGVSKTVIQHIHKGRSWRHLARQFPAPAAIGGAR